MLVVLSKSNYNGIEVWKPKILQFLDNLTDDYPNFYDWINMVFNQLPLGTRVILMDVCNDLIRGLAILKNDSDEKKICTFKVDEKFQHQGIGTYLLHESYKILDTKNLMISVSERHVSSFRPFLEKEGFELKMVAMSLYRPGRREFFFNRTP